ncbi:MAG: TIGR03943 family protein [Kineosporiaceae bacterium]
MRRALAATLLLLTGGALIRLVLSEQHLRYVKEAMALPLLATGAVVVVLGFVGWWLATGSRRPVDRTTPGAVGAEGGPGGPGGQAGHHGHEAHLPPVAWLLLLPVLAIYLVPPPALGSDAVLRESQLAVAPGAELFPPLPAGDPVVLTPREAVERVLYDPGSGVLEREVQVIGFAVPDPETGQWYVARISLACCAADGVAHRILVEGVPPPAADQWVSVTGRLRSPGGPTADQPIPRLAATEVGPYEAPANPYD